VSVQGTGLPADRIASTHCGAQSPKSCHWTMRGSKS
jgi:hypothetical protein